jgi:YidC/Oxa1 family membrane protein insertase
MSQKPNTLLRLLVPLVLLAGAVGLFFLIINKPPSAQRVRDSEKGANPAAAQAPAATPPGTPSNTPPAPAASTSAQAAPAATDAATPNPDAAATTGASPATPSALVKLRPRVWGPGARTSDFGAVGSTVLDRSPGGRRFELRFSPYGAGLESVKLANHRELLDDASPPLELQKPGVIETPVYQDGKQVGTYVNTIVPMALMDVTINGRYVNVFASPDGPIWRQVEWGTFECELLDESGALAARITRSYKVEPGAYDLVLEQRLDNRTTAAMSVVWRQLGPIDLPMGVVRYGGDPRRVRLGYLTPPASDPDQQVVLADPSSPFMLTHAEILGSPTFDGARGEFTFGEMPLWPDKNGYVVKNQYGLAWVAMANRHFAVSAHPLSDRLTRPGPASGKPVPDKRFLLAGAPVAIDRVVLAPPTADKSLAVEKAATAVRLTTGEVKIEPGQGADFSMGVYAGPISRSFIDGEPRLASMGVGELVVYSFGGPCAFCTFQAIAHLLRSYLGVLHGYVVFDWALAIIVLVVTVRTLLHPITRWSQVSLTRFGKQMAALAPKQAKLKEKFGNDPKRFREEVAKLMREENVNYAGALGCLPMFLQTPVWIALSAMIFFTFELRHAGGFFGVFQSFGGWSFLGDLSEPDHFIQFPAWMHFSIPLMGQIDALNILPLILGVVFYIQQKYLTPPTTTTLTPEQEQQQKIMKVMMVVMFPLLMYNAPSALALYFMANSTLGIIESRWIRASVEAADAAKAAAGGDKPAGETPSRPGSRKVKNEAAKPAGFLERVRAALEERQRQLEQKRKQNPGRPGKGPR